jgi:hypothetical protein
VCGGGGAHEHQTPVPPPPKKKKTPPMVCVRFYDNGRYVCACACRSLYSLGATKPLNIFNGISLTAFGFWIHAESRPRLPFHASGAIHQRMNIPARVQRPCDGHGRWPKSTALSQCQNIFLVVSQRAGLRGGRFFVGAGAHAPRACKVPSLIGRRSKIC